MAQHLGDGAVGRGALQSALELRRVRRLPVAEREHLAERRREVFQKRESVLDLLSEEEKETIKYSCVDKIHDARTCGRLIFFGAFPRRLTANRSTTAPSDPARAPPAPTFQYPKHLQTAAGFPHISFYMGLCL